MSVFNVQIIGRCGICGGRVTVPTVFWSVVPPVPTCEQCGATHHEEDKLPTLPMRPAPRTQTTTGTKVTFWGGGYADDF